MRPIDADKLIDCVGTVQELALAIGGDLEAIKPVNEGFISLINSMPTIEAEPVRHGHWTDNDIDPEAWNFCSVCGEQSIDNYDYCPNCGAKMDEEE